MCETAGLEQPCLKERESESYFVLGLVLCIIFLLSRELFICADVCVKSTNKLYQSVNRVEVHQFTVQINNNEIRDEKDQRD